MKGCARSGILYLLGYAAVSAATALGRLTGRITGYLIGALSTAASSAAIVWFNWETLRPR